MQASKLQGSGDAAASSAGGSKGHVEDLFSAHDFDIQIDLPTSNEGMLQCMCSKNRTCLCDNHIDSAIEGGSIVSYPRAWVQS